MRSEKSPADLLKRQQRFTSVLKFARELNDTDPNRGVRFLAKTAIFVAELAAESTHDRLLNHVYDNDSRVPLAYRTHGEFNAGLPTEDVAFEELGLTARDQEY
ncbi:MAG TPA: hypothetical protein VNG32_03815 [Candidatus Dormibacteraeota bacterium]|nr:hypothetical protein [Candidatus Dormibacteraeota bacterium]